MSIPLAAIKRSVTHLAKDNALADGEELVQRDKDVVFVLSIAAVHVELPDVVDAELLLLQFDLVCVWRDLCGV